MRRKGIVLAGGSGSRLKPITMVVNKQLLPVYNKPMIYYPLSILLEIGVQDILIITNGLDKKLFYRLLGNGERFGVNIKYKVQPKPNGIAAGYILSEKFLNGSPSVMILGDNIFYGSSLVKKLKKSFKNKNSSIFTYEVNNPDQYGVYKNFNGKRIIIEKPKKFVSKDAVVGIYFLDKNAPKLAKKLKYSNRQELEITDLNNLYLKKKNTRVVKLDKGVAWLDTGSFDGLLNAANFVMTLEKRQGLTLGSFKDFEIKKTKK